jgi:YD repeat-containing protein
MEEVIGGFEEIVRVERYSSFQAQRVTSLTGHTASNVWNEIPDELRTYVHMRITANANVGSMELSYPAADLAGRRIWVAEDNVMTPGVPSDAATITMNVLIDEVLALKPNGQPATFDADTGYGTHGNQIDIEVAIHHPIFTVSGGEAATATSSYDFEAWNAFPSYFAFGFGERGTRAQVRNTAAVPNSGLASWPNDSECLPGNWGAQCSFVLRDTFSAQMNSQVTSAEAFLKHASDLGDLVAGASGGRHVNLHSVAMASMFVELNTAQAPYSQCNSSGCGTIPYDGLLAPKLSGQRLVVDVTSRSGFAGYDAGASGRDVFASTYAAMLVGTEQAILQSNTDNPSIGTPPAMFEWFADASRSEAFNASANSSYQIRFVEIPAGLGTQAREDGLDAIWHGPNSPVANSLFGQEYGDFNLISPQSGRVGPLRSSVRVNDPQDPASEHEFVDLTTCSANCTIETFDAAGAYRTRMSGFVAVQNTASGIAIAPIGLSGLKGGGGATFPDSIEPPTADREALDEAYESWATAFSVDGRTGGLTLTPPADITTGAGGNPYTLGFQRSYSSDNLSDGVLGVGWTHNWSARLSTSTDIDAALGGQSPHQGLATIVAIQALHNLFETPSSDIQDLPTAMLIANWWSGQVFDNTATISRGAESERFYLQPDGVWAPQPGSFASLSRTGTRTSEANQTVPEPGDSSTYNPRIVAESFNRSGWSFTYEGPDGTTESFTYGFDLSTGNYDPRLTGLRAVYHSRSTNAIGSSSSFLRRSTNRIAAPDTAYVYEQVSESGRYVGELLREVSNGAPFGRHIYLDYYLWQGSDGIPADPYAETGVAGPDSARSGPVARRLQYVRDENGTRQVSFGYDGFGYLVSATDILGNVTTYQYDFDFPVANTVFAGGIYQDRDLLTSLRLPHDPNNNFISITYTDEGRTQSVAERDGHTTQYFVAAGSRARSRNPAGTDSFSYYDRDGRQFANQIIRASWARHQDRVIRNHFDAWGRTTYTEGGYVEDLDYLADRNETYYDQLSNTVLTRSLGGTNASGVPLTTNVLETVTEYGYAPFPNLPTVQIDSNGNATTTCYERTTVAPCNSNSIQDPTVPDGLPRATYGAEGEESLIEYDSLGRVTRQRVRIEN